MLKKQIKPFLTYTEQLAKLTEEKNLLISDSIYAQDCLTNISYYALIGGYKQLFYNPMTRQYRPGTTFDDLIQLYYFDESLRALFFKYLCHIEQKMRSLISYYFSQTYSHMEKDYLNAANYNNSRKNSTDIQRLIQMLTIEARSNTNHPYVVYQRNTYGNVPLWVMMNTLTFGQLSKMYSFLKTSVQTKISINFNNVNEKQLGQYLKALTYYRNVCAHNERLYSFRCRVDMPDTILHQKLGISRKGNQYVLGKSDLFSVVIAFRYLLPRSEFIDFKKQLVKLMNSVLVHSHTLTEPMLLNAMGFPQNWRNITRYKL
ncbi:MAG: Abi family protein [Clostridiales bacterium]|nr:Abi family protein [Clostridiales bacterium]